MAPAAGSRRSAPPPKDGIYRPSPRLKQARFAPPRKLGRGCATPRIQQEGRTLKQQTLTQINFVPGGSGDPFVLSESEADDLSDKQDDDGEAEAKAQAGSHETDVEDDEPRTSARRRTGSRVEKGERRSTPRYGGDRFTERTGDSGKKRRASPPVRVRQTISGQTPSSTLHTQTITQFYERDYTLPTLDLGDDEDQADATLAAGPSNAKDDRRGIEERVPFQEGPLVPQSPPLMASAPLDEDADSLVDDHRCDDLGKRRRPSKRTSSPPRESRKKLATGEAKRYSRILVIEDSFVMDTMGSDISTSHQSQGVSSKDHDVDESCSSRTMTPRPATLKHGDKPSSASKAQRRFGFNTKNILDSKQQKTSGGGSSSRPIEIPDSEEDVSDDEEFDVVSVIRLLDEGSQQEEFSTGVETQHVMDELASKEHQPLAPERASPDPTTQTSALQASRRPASSPVILGAQMMSQVQKDAKARVPTTTPTPEKTVSSRYTGERELLRRPVKCAQNPSQGAESQRVAVEILQALPGPSARSDILLLCEPDALESILAGYELSLRMPFNIPRQVVRFWLLSGSFLRYMACVRPAIFHRADWTYVVDQVFELNNPVTDAEMRDEGWVRGPVKRYDYLPPAVVGQLLWNLKRAIFSEHCTGPLEQPHTMPDDFASPVSDLGNHQTPRRESPALNTHISRQDPPNPRATDLTPSQVPSPTAEQRPQIQTPISFPQNSTTHPPTALPTLPDLPDAPHQPSTSLTGIHHSSSQHIPQSSISSSLVFQDLGDSVTAPSGIHLNLSQLLTKSQMLPDSLFRDVPWLPYEVWDSEDDIEP